jgi:hypothetical protein
VNIVGCARDLPLSALMAKRVTVVWELMFTRALFGADPIQQARAFFPRRFWWRVVYPHTARFRPCALAVPALCLRAPHPTPRPLRLSATARHGAVQHHILDAACRLIDGGLLKLPALKVVPWTLAALKEAHIGCVPPPVCPAPGARARVSLSQ